MALDPTQIVANSAYGTQAYQAKQQALDTGQQRLQSGQQNIDIKKIQQASDKLDYSLHSLGQVHDQNSFDAWHQAMNANGIDTTGDPTVYDPAWQKQSIEAGVSAKDRLQIEALKAYRQNTLALKAADKFGSVEEAARNGYRRADDGVNWQPIDNTNPLAMLGGPQPAPSSNPTQAQMDAPAAPIPANPPPLPNGFGGTANLNSPAGMVGQDPVQVSQQAIAQQQAQTGISPAQRPDLANLPAPQVAAMPMGQRPGETLSHARLRFLQQGGTQDAMIQSRMRETGEDYATAASAIKNGIGQGNTVVDGSVVPRSGSLSANSQQASAKSEGHTYGADLGKQMEGYRSAAEAAQGMDATLNAMKADADKFRMGAMSDMQGTAKSYLQALSQSLGVPTPEMDQSLGAQQAFTKSAMGLVMGGMQKVQGRAFGEMKAIQSAFPTQAMSKGGFDLVTSQIAGTNQYSEALYQAASDYRQQHNTLDGFENTFQKNVSPWAYVVKNMDGTQLTDLRNNLSQSDEGRKELKMLADQIRFAKTHGYMQ